MKILETLIQSTGAAWQRVLRLAGYHLRAAGSALLTVLALLMCSGGALAQTNNAQFISQVVPSAMISGSTGNQVWVTVKNTGTSTWTAASQYFLGSQNPQDNGTWGMGRVALPNSVAPGDSVTFNFTVTAPSTAGGYNFQWRMLREGVEWFGELTSNVLVNSTPTAFNGAEFVSQNVPTSMTPGQSYTVPVTMRNSGTTTWTAANAYKLGSQNPGDNSTWGTGRVDVVGSVLPGQQYTFQVPAKAPTTPGTYNFQWKMVREFVEWFGVPSTNAIVAVGVAGETITYFHNDAAGTPQVATDANGNVLWKETYRPYGDKLNNQPASTNNNLWFTGKPHDSNTGLTYMGARYYDPLLGRFVGMDPQGVVPDNVHSFNRYAYANNNPYKFVDPDGHSPIDVAFLIYDIGKLGVAMYTGVGVGAAVVDVGMSAVGVMSPIPFAGQAMKAARAAERAVEVARVAEKANEAKHAAKGVSTLKPGPFAKESIPGHMGKPTAAEQREVNKLMEKHGCHTCGTKNPGTKSGNSIVDHQPAQALGETTEFFPHCIDCMRRQGGEVLQELIKRGTN
ncbi:hypothetical protein GCM10027277_30120 [Pseudoduganella ginsengisoli]